MPILCLSFLQWAFLSPHCNPPRSFMMDHVDDDDAVVIAMTLTTFLIIQTQQFAVRFLKTQLLY